MHPVMKLGMSKDSPFLGQYTEQHPSTKKILDYDFKPSNNRGNVDMAAIAVLPIEEQIKILQTMSSLGKPKMFTNLVRQGMSKEMQQKVTNIFDKNLQAQVRTAMMNGSCERQLTKQRADVIMR